jgi:hypothetical protein
MGRLTRGPSHTATGEHVQVKVPDRLTTIRARIDDEAKSARSASLLPEP